jgi:hypothetical protein
VNSQKPRSRVVVFRLTEHEFTQLKLAATRSQRSLSDFTRTGVLSAIHTDQDRSAIAIRDQISEMQMVLQDLKELVQCMLSRDGEVAG